MLAGWAGRRGLHAFGSVGVSPRISTAPTATTARVSPTLHVRLPWLGWGESNGDDAAANGDDAAACGARAGCVGDGHAQFFGATVSVWIRTSSFGGPSPLPSLVPSLAMAATTSSPAVTLPNGV